MLYFMSIIIDDTKAIVHRLELVFDSKSLTYSYQIGNVI